MIRAFSLAFCVLLATSPMALSQSLGLGAGFVELGQTEPEHGEARQSGRILMDFTISAHHGIEASAALEETPLGTTGTLTGVAYMRPTNGLRYGLFGSLSDLDGEAASWGYVGAAGIWALSDRLSLGAHGAIGRRVTGPRAGGRLIEPDTLMGGIDLSAALSDNLIASAALSVAEFDEWRFRATASELRAGLTYHVPRTPLGLEASVIHDRLDGPNGAPAETRLRLGLFIQFGPRPSQAEMRPFQLSDPIAQLVRRGM